MKKKQFENFITELGKCDKCTNLRCKEKSLINIYIDEIHSLMKDNKFFKNHYEEFEILLNCLKEGKK